MAARAGRLQLVDRARLRIGCQGQEVETLEGAQFVGEMACAGVGERERGADGHTERSSGERVGAGVVEDQAVPSEGRGVADDRADVGRVVHGFDDDETIGRFGDLRDRRTGRSFEERDDAVGIPEPGHDTAHVHAAAVHRASESPGERDHVVDVDERGDGHTAGGECPLDDEVALGEEQPGAGVVAFLGAARQPALVEPELPEPRIVRILDRHDLHLCAPTHVCVAISGQRCAEIATQTGNDGIRRGWAISSGTGRGTSRRRAFRGSCRGLPGPRRCRRRGGSPHRRTPAGRPGRRRSG